MKSLILNILLLTLTITVLNSCERNISNPLKSKRYTDSLNSKNFDPSKPFQIHFSSNGGGDFHDIFSLSNVGTIQALRTRPEIINNNRQIYHESKTSNFDFKTTSTIAQLIIGAEILNMNGSYGKNALDGSWQLLLIKQGKYSKSIFTSNFNPDQINKLEELLNASIENPNLKTTKWTKINEIKFTQLESLIINEIETALSNH